MKKKVKIIVDALMSIALVILLSFSVTGQLVHEIMGTLMLALFITHHILNRKWIKAVAKGKYTPIRIYQTTLTAFCLVCMAGSAISGIILSRYVFGFVDIPSGLETARKAHMLFAYLGMIFMSLHIGVHLAKIKSKLLLALLCIISAVGVYSFAALDIIDYLTLKIMFVPSGQSILVSLGYICIIILFATVSMLVSKLILRKK